MNKIRLGMLGAGAISRVHLDAVMVRKDAEVICIADVDEKQAQQRAREYDIKRSVSDYQSMMNMEDIDGVIIAIPTAYHAEASLAALKRGKHVLCEKPMARTVEECRQMIDTAGEQDLVLQIAFVRRFDPAWLKLRELVQEGKAGRPCMWRRIIAGSAPQPPKYGTWYTDSRYSDGPLMENGSHDLDFVCYTFGEVEAVTASTRKFGELGDVEDTVNLIVDFVSGDQMLFSWSWSLPLGAEGFGGLDIIGPNGVIREPVQVEGNKYMISFVSAGGNEEEHSFLLDRDKEWYTGQMANFIDAIQGKTCPRADGQDGLRVQRIMEAAHESTISGMRVEL